MLPTLRSASLLHGLHPASGSTRLTLLIAPLLLGCSQTPPVSVDEHGQESLLALMPHRVNIVEPFTIWSDLDPKPGIDGISVYVQPVNGAGDPIQAAGSMFVELYAYRPATADHKGERKGIWDFPLKSESDQQTRWNRATQMYEFPIILPPELLPPEPAAKFVLTVTHNPPLGVRSFDKYILEAPRATAAFAGQR